MTSSTPTRLRLVLQYAFLATTFLTILHLNVVQPYVLRGRPAAPAAGAPVWQRAPAFAYALAVEAGKQMGLSLIWRMYSPVPRDLRQTEWLAQDAGGQWVSVPAPGVSTARRSRRSWADALLWDFKRARINDNYFVYRYDAALPRRYVEASRPGIVRALGSVPRALRVLVRTERIPAPAEKGAWDPERAVFSTIEWERVYQ
jgi:hypothetical protein